MDTDQQVKGWIKRIQKFAHKKSANWLISHYFDEIYGYVYKQVSNEETAIEVTQETFVSMLQSIVGYDDSKSSFRTWLYKITKRRIVDYYRSNGYKEDRLMAIDDELTSTLVSSLADAHDALELAEINDFIDELDSTSQEIFKLKVFSGQTFKGISQILDIPESTVKANFYATQKLVKEVFLWTD